MRALEYIARHIAVGDDIFELVVDVCRVDIDRFARMFIRSERNIVEHFFHDRVEPPRADVFALCVYVFGEKAHTVDRILGKTHRHSFRFEERNVLFCKRIFRLGENFFEIVFFERIEFHAQRKASLGAETLNAPAAINKI